MKKTTKLCVLFSLLNIQLFAGITGCELPEDNNFKASYEFTTPKGQNSLNYYRLQGKRGFEYPQQGITEVWNKTLKNKAYLIRGFDNAKRSIEYEVIDLTMENKNSSWEKRNNIMSPDNFHFDKVVVKKDKRCKIAQYTKNKENLQIKMLWNISKDMLISLEVKTKGKVSYDYALTKIKAIKEKDNHISRVQAYNRTDFADIGDNESDPFFRKMINLGFIAHHEANIMDSNGHQLSLVSSHKH